MTMALMREPYFVRHEPWIREPLPYFVDGPYGGGFREAHQFPILPQDHFFSPGFAAPSPYGEPMGRIPRSSSAMPAFGHFSEAPFLERPGPLRSSSAIPTYAYPPEVPFHDSPLPHGPTRSSSSIPSFREPRESRPKHHKVGPEIELRVPMCCSKCEAKVKETLGRVTGVTNVITDRRASLVTVCGKVDPQVALKQVQKTKKKADFYRKQIYSDNFINFIQSKTGRAEPEEEPELTSSYHQHVPSECGDSHHAYDENENLSSYEEYPGYSERDEDDSHDEVERGPVHSFSIDDDDLMERKRGYYNQLNYGQRNDIPPYGMPSSSFEESYRTVDDRPRYESPYYSHVEPSYGLRERMPYYDRESPSMYGDYGPSYAESSSYRPSQSYAPSQGYGPSGISNPGYMKHVISDY